MLYNYKLEKLNNLDFGGYSNPNAFNTFNFFYIEEFDKLAVGCLKEDFSTDYSSNTMMLFTGEHYKNKKIQIEFSQYRELKFNYATKNKILFITNTGTSIIYGLNMVNGEKIEIETEAGIGHGIVLLEENGTDCFFGRYFSKKILEIDIEEKVVREEEGNLKFKKNQIFLPNNNKIYSFKPKNKLLKIFNSTTQELEQEIEMGKIQAYNMEEGEKMVEWIKNWVCVISMKHELYHHVKIVLCASFFSKTEILKLALEGFGYPTYASDKVEEEDPFLRIFDSKVENEENKKILKEYLVRKGRLEVFNNEQLEKIKEI